MIQKQITNIQVGIVQGKVAWVFDYAQHPPESFSLHLPVARQFMQGLQELVLLLEHHAVPAGGTVDGVGMQETVAVRLQGPPVEQEEEHEEPIHTDKETDQA